MPSFRDADLAAIKARYESNYALITNDPKKLRTTLSFVTVAEYMRAQARNAALHVLEAGHWPQIDEPADVARIMLASQ